MKTQKSSSLKQAFLFNGQIYHNVSEWAVPVAQSHLTSAYPVKFQNIKDLILKILKMKYHKQRYGRSVYELLEYDKVALYEAYRYVELIYTGDSHIIQCTKTGQKHASYTMSYNPNGNYRFSKNQYGWLTAMVSNHDNKVYTQNRDFLI